MSEEQHSLGKPDYISLSTARSVPLSEGRERFIKKLGEGEWSCRVESDENGCLILPLPDEICSAHDIQTGDRFILECCDRRMRLHIIYGLSRQEEHSLSKVLFSLVIAAGDAEEDILVSPELAATCKRLLPKMGEQNSEDLRAFNKFEASPGRILLDRYIEPRGLSLREFADQNDYAKHPLELLVLDLIRGDKDDWATLAKLLETSEQFWADAECSFRTSLFEQAVLKQGATYHVGADDVWHLAHELIGALKCGDAEQVVIHADEGCDMRLAYQNNVTASEDSNDKLVLEPVSSDGAGSPLEKLRAAFKAADEEMRKRGLPPMTDEEIVEFCNEVKRERAEKMQRGEE